MSALRNLVSSIAGFDEAQEENWVLWLILTFNVPSLKITSRNRAFVLVYTIWVLKLWVRAMQTMKILISFLTKQLFMKGQIHLSFKKRDLAV